MVAGLVALILNLILPQEEAEDDDDVFEPLSHNEALARVRKTIADLAIDLDEVDRYVHVFYSHLFS